MPGPTRQQWLFGLVALLVLVLFGLLVIFGPGGTGGGTGGY